ncbi:polysaccharide export protein [Marivivens donghaensis]|uniref:Polysaccharide export protein n=1 Tax=Marivivens donghaensis TaxID=1699413 RepID=A0ABX0W1B0_9RHOB|nr:polysaccharide biosynthesis/export family protein [Marivivens donghaensis]NIY73770.1 polysaccharide export protein [Marivivens donghaensis]
MSSVLKRSSALLLCFSVAACDVPRGAGFEGEVLAVKDDQQAGEVVAYPFEVIDITRETQALVSRWPSSNGRAYNWPSRVEQPASIIIEPGDLLSIAVWDAEENSLLTGPGQQVASLERMRVNSEGRIFLPFVGEMKVSGMSPQTARSRIEEEYNYSIPSAQVQIDVVPGRANTADIVGGVSAPGSYPLQDRNVSVLSLIALGGGVPSNLNNPQVKLFRGSNRYTISLERLYADPSLDTIVRGGDRVIVEKDSRTFLSLGAAGSEALHEFPTDDVNALEALAIVGGVADDRANPKGILILREYPNSAIRANGTGPTRNRVVFTIDLTTADGLFSAGQFHIQPGDLIYATESPVNSARTIMGILGSAIGIANRL